MGTKGKNQRKKKTQVIKLEPKGWERRTDPTAQGKQTGSTSSSSCTRGRKCSSAAIEVDVDPEGPSVVPSVPEVAMQNGFLPFETSTQSTTTSSKKHGRKASAVSVVCDVDEVDEMQVMTAQADTSSRRPQKPPSTKELRASLVLPKLGTNELIQTSEKEGNRAPATQQEGKPAGNKTSRGRGKAKTSKASRKREKSSYVICTESSPSCYLPLDFTSPVPGAAVKKGRATRRANVSTTSTEETTQREVEDHQSSSGIEKKKSQPSQPAQPSAEHSEVHEVTDRPTSQQNGVHEEVTNEVKVIFPSSEESPGVAQDTDKATDARDAQSVVSNTEKDLVPCVKVIETSGSRRRTRSGIASGINIPSGSYSKLPDSQTSTVAGKEFKQTKRNRRSTKGIKSATDKPTKPDVMQTKPGSSKTVETSPTYNSFRGTSPDIIDPAQREEGSVEPHEAGLAYNSKSSKSGTASLVEMESTQGMTNSARPVVRESPQIKAHSIQPVVTSHAQSNADNAQPMNTSSTPSERDEQIKANPTHDKADSCKPCETDQVHSNTLSPIKEVKLYSHKLHEIDAIKSPVSAGQIYDEELFDLDSSLQQRDAITQPFTEAVGIAKTTLPTPPQSSQPEASASHAFKDTNNRHILPQIVQQTRSMKATENKPLPKKTPFPSPLEENTNADADGNTNRSTFVEGLKKKIVMSPIISLVQVEAITSLQDEGGLDTTRNDPVEALGPQKEASPIEEDIQVQRSADQSRERSATESLIENTDNTSKNYEPQKRTSPVQEDVCVKGYADVSSQSNKRNEKSVINRPSESSDYVVRSDEQDIIQEEGAVDSISQNNANRSRDKSARRGPEQPHQDQQQQISMKGVPHSYKQSRRGISQGRTPKDTGINKEQQVAYPKLHKPREISPVRRLSTARIRNKRKLFDPTAQSNVEVDLSPMPQVEKAGFGAFEDNHDKSLQVDSRTRELKHKTSTGYLPDHNGGTIDKLEPQSNKKKRRVSKSEGNCNAKGYSRGRASANNTSPPRRASGFLEDSGMEEPHSVYSDLESSPVGEIDTWFLDRIRKINHSTMTYHNTSSRKSSQGHEKSQKVKKKMHGTKDSKNNSVSYHSTSSAMEGLSDSETYNKPQKKTCSTSATTRNTTEHIYSYTSSADNPEGKVVPRKRSTFAFLTTSASSSEVSQTSSHEEWFPPSSKKKKPLPQKERPKYAVTNGRGRRAGRQQRLLGDGSSLEESGQQVENTFIDSAIPEDNSELTESSFAALRHTSRSSVDSSTSNFMTFKLVASKGKATDNATMDSGGEVKCFSVVPQTSPLEPQKSVESQTPLSSSSLQEILPSTPQRSSPHLFTLSPEPQISPPVLHISTPALQVLSVVPQISPDQEKPCIQPAMEDLQSDSDTNQAQQQYNDTPDSHDQPSSASMPKQDIVVSTQPFDVGVSSDLPDITTDLPDITKPLETTNSMDISAIPKPGSGTQAPLSGPLQSTMLDSLLDKSKSPAPRFSYVSEEEASYINHEQLTVVRDENSAAHRSPSINDPIKAELRYDKDQTPSLTTITTTADVHQPDTVHSLDIEPTHQSGSLLSKHSDSPYKSLQIELSTCLSDKASRSELKEQESSQIRKSCDQPSLIHTVTPTAKVPPQSTSTPIRSSQFISKMYKQLLQDSLETPPSSRHGDSPIRPRAKNLFGVERGEAASDERMKFNINMVAAVMAVKADLERMSNSTYRLSKTLGTMATLYMEHLSGNRAT